MHDAVIAEEFGQCNGGFVKDASSQLEKVRCPIMCDDAIYGRIQIGSEGKKIDLDNTQAICILDTGDQFFVLEIRFFKHGCSFRNHVPHDQLRFQCPSNFHKPH